MLRALSTSFERAPVGSMHLDKGALELVESLFVEMFNAGIVFAAPVLVLLMLVSVLIGLLARAVPQVNVLEMGFTLRIGVALVAMLVFAPALAPAMDVLFKNLMGGLEGCLDVLGS